MDGRLACAEGFPLHATCPALYIGPVAMSGLIELAQAYCTTDRSGDWLDLAANAIGALAGIVLSGMLTRKMRKKA